MSATFYSETDWEQSSGPIVPRKVHLEANDDTDLLWPWGAPFDTLADGEHPVFAFGPKAQRPNNVTGAVITYNSDTEIAVMNFGDKYIVRAYVVNILTYSEGAAATWVNTVYPGYPVYVDDSAPVAAAGAGVTLSFSPLNASGAPNPLAGYIFWCQDEYADINVGGPNSTQQIDQPAETDTTEVLTLCVLIVNDSGQTDWQDAT